MNFDPHLALAVAQTESNLNINAVGSQQDVGVMQVRTTTVGIPKARLMNVYTNIREGIKQLKLAQQKCKHKLDKTWLTCYNLGQTGGSKIQHPKLFPYYLTVMRNYAANKKIYKETAPILWSVGNW